MLTLPKVAGLVIVILGLVLLFGGCTNQAAQLQPQIVAADAAVSSAHTLFMTGGLSAANARKLSADAHIADVGFKAALAAINSGQSPTQTTVNQILASLAQLSLDLQTTPQARAAAGLIQKRLAAHQGKSLGPAEVIALINLAVELTPVVIQEMNVLFSGSPITPADCQAALEKFESNLAALDGAISH